MATEDDVRRICAALPETSELLSAGVPYFRVERHGFARLRQDPQALVVWTADVSDKESMLRACPEKFFTTPHYEGQPAILVRLDAVDVPELTDLLVSSWRLRAPIHLRELFDQESRRESSTASSSSGHES
jgi:hypothetical protein